MQLIRSIGNMIGYKKSLSEWQCLSEVKMGRGSPIPPMLRRKIVEQYQKGVSQRKIAKSLKLSSSTVHNIIQRFRESGTISVRKGQGRKTILDARDLRALRRHCITYRNATVMEITTWAQEYFQKTLSVFNVQLQILIRLTTEQFSTLPQSILNEPWPRENACASGSCLDMARPLPAKTL